MGKLFAFRRRLSKKLIGRHIFLADFMAANQTLHPRWASNPEFSRAVMAQHGRLWRMLGAEGQLDYEARAQASDKVRQDLLQEKLGDIEELMLQHASFKMSSSAWSLSDVQELLRMFSLDVWSQNKVQDLRAEALLPPEPPTEQAQQELGHAEVPLEQREPQVPGWMKAIAKLRQAFGGSVLALITEHEPTFWLFLYARQSPFRLYFLELLVQHGVRYQATQGSFAEVLKACAAEPVWCFQRASTKVSLDYELPLVSAEQVFVLPQVAFHPHNSDSFASWAAFRPLEACVEPEELLGSQDGAHHQSEASCQAQPQQVTRAPAEVPLVGGLCPSRGHRHRLCRCQVVNSSSTAEGICG